MKLLPKQCSRRPVILCIMAFLFMVVYASVYIQSHSIYRSPDEMSVAVFTESFIDHSTFRIQAPDPNPQNVIHPRSVNIIDTHYVPVGFLGTPLILGGIGKVFGWGAVMLFPSLLAVMAIICFYYLMKNIFSEDIAFYTAISSFFLAPLWYYTSRGFLPNSLLTSFFIMSYTALLYSSSVKKKARYLLIMAAGLMAGAGLIIRPIAVYWCFIPMIVYFCIHKRWPNWKNMLFFSLPVVVAIACLAYAQSLTYGAWYLTGYQSLSIVEGGEVVQSSHSLLESFFYSVLPFGVDLIGSVYRFLQFSFLLVPFNLLLGLLGGIVLNHQEKKIAINQQIYQVSLLLITITLVLYYGAWGISDHPDAEWVSLGVSYMRYWLPIYLLLTPLCILGSKHLALKTRYRYMLPALVILLCLSGVVAVISFRKDSLGANALGDVNYRELQQEILVKTPAESIIVTTRHDKLIWPHREVITLDEINEQGASMLGKAIEFYPMYWLTDLPISHIHTIDQKFLSPESLRLGDSIDLGGGFMLIEIIHYD